MDDNKKDQEQAQDTSKPIETQLSELEKEETSPNSSDSSQPDTSEATPPLLSDISPSLPASSQPPVKRPNWFKRFIHTKKGKVITIILSLLVVAGILFAVPTTRYGILGYFIKRDVALVILDSKTKKPVSQATVEMASLSAKTDKNGKVTLADVPVGEYSLKVTKKYYQDSSSSYTVPIFTDAATATINLNATGRQVVVTLTNLITKKPIKDATIAAEDSSSLTDEKGEATLVLPADKQKITAKLTREKYNESTVDITVTDQADVNKFTLTPSGTIYYLSKATGKINVMKANLDGTTASVVVQATGNESDNDTALLAARDWKYLALFAKRKADVAGQLYLVDAKTNALKTIDEGNVEIQLIGWSDHRFLYIVTRNDVKEWENKHQAIKSYDAETGKLTTLDETTATGNSYTNSEYEWFGSPYIVEGKLLYAKTVSRGVGAPHDKKPSIMLATVANGQAQKLKEFTFTQQLSSLDAKLYQPLELFFRVKLDNAVAEFYEYENGSLKSITNDDNKFYNTVYPTFFVSPNSQKTFWHESRNGKNAIFAADKNGLNSKELAQQSDYATYGWFTDDYVLLSKNKSELYIASADGPLDTPLKITNYHKPALQFQGYGYGYGGL